MYLQTLRTRKLLRSSAKHFGSHFYSKVHIRNSPSVMANLVAYYPDF
jgi:hypothetical protein